MVDVQYTHADDIADLMQNYDRSTVIPTPMYSQLTVNQHQDFSIAARLVRGDIPTGEDAHTRTPDFDLATRPSPNFNRLSNAIQQAILADNNRRFR